MTAGHIAALLLILALIVLLLRPKEQELRVDTVPAQAQLQPSFRLFAPCPLAPRNLPTQRGERTA